MKKIYLFIAICLVNLAVSVAVAQEPRKKLTHWISPEDILRWNEIGLNFVQTDPPVAPVRNVAEFDRMQGVLVAYPFGIPVNLIVEMAKDVKVTTIVASVSEQNTVTQLYQNAGVNLSHCNFLIAPSDSYWTRDYGPWFESDSLNHIGIVDFPYNRPTRPNDDNIPGYVATMLGVPMFGMNVIHTGGNYMTDGLGYSSSTKLVWEENPTQTHDQIAQKVHDYLGISNYRVVDDPNNTYIDHIDCWGKFLAPDKILIRSVPPSHPQYSAIEATAAYYGAQICSYGYNYRVFRVYTPDDQPYTNSLILNNKVFVPVMNSAWDDSALTAYAAAMPGCQVFGVLENPAAPWESTDALHCRTMGIADVGQIYIHHIPLSGSQPAQDNFHIRADLIRCSDSTAYPDSVLIWYKVNNGQFMMSHMTQVSGDHYEGCIPKQPAGSIIRYYLYAADRSGRHDMKPIMGPVDPFTFTSVYTDLTAEPDTLWFRTFDDMLDGKSTFIKNYVSSTIPLDSLETIGYFPSGTAVGWALNPVPAITLPYPMAPGDSLECHVVILFPIDKSPGNYIIDTFHFASTIGSHQVILMINDSLLTGIKDGKNPAGPILFQNYPNPFTGNTTIRFALPRQEKITLEIYDLQGMKICSFKDHQGMKGTNLVSWNGCTDEGKICPSGIYFIRLVSEEKILTRRMVLIR
jgi:agmatine deiminase